MRINSIKNSFIIQNETTTNIPKQDRTKNKQKLQANDMKNAMM